MSSIIPETSEGEQRPTPEALSPDVLASAREFVAVVEGGPEAWPMPADRFFVMGARLYVPALLAELDRTRAELAEVRAEGNRYHSAWHNARDRAIDARSDADIADAELAATRVNAFREAARLLEATDRDDDAVNFLDLLAASEPGAES